MKKVFKVQVVKMTTWLVTDADNATHAGEMIREMIESGKHQPGNQICIETGVGIQAVVEVPVV